MILLHDIETPIQRVEWKLKESDGPQIHIKREDLIHPFISGNKWRKLRYVLEDAGRKECKRLVSFGGPWSNHLVALACAGASSGFATTGIVRGEPVDNVVMRLCTMWGMQLEFVSREQYQHKQEYFERRYPHSDAYFIDEGGRGELGMRGCMDIVPKGGLYTHILCAVGTGTTLAGIAKAALAQGMKAEGICVLKHAEGLTDDISRMSGLPATVHHQYHRGGYAKTDPELLQFIQTFASGTGILLDQVYTGKLMMAVFDLIDMGYFSSKDNVLVVHTGGLTGLISQLIPDQRNRT